MVRVLVVDDSAVACEHLARILNTGPGIQVVGTAHNGDAAIRFVKLLNPDLVTMDIHMPLLDGIEATRRIMAEHPVPIIIISSSYRREDTFKAFQAMEAGALMIIEKPVGMGHGDYLREGNQLRNYVRIMSEIKVAKRSRKSQPGNQIPLITKDSLGGNRPRTRLIVIGASTGGPNAIAKILSGLTVKIPVPVLIVQHMVPGFIEDFVRWLEAASGCPVRIAGNEEAMENGTVYVAPDNFQLSVTGEHLMRLSREPRVDGLRPTVGRLFSSAAKYYGSSALGIILTGMGTDGSSELKQIRDCGGITIAQDPNSCIVNGMPGTAVRMGAAQYVLSPERIAELLSSLRQD